MARITRAMPAVVLVGLLTVSAAYPGGQSADLA